MGDLFPEHLETERLRLEALGPESIDVFALYEAFADDPDPDDVYAHVPLSPPETPHDSWEFVDRAASNRDEGDAVTYLIRPRDGEEGAGEIAGTTTLFCQWDRKTAGFAILLRKPFWGRGYSGERASALIELAFSRLDLECVGTSCVAGNERSRRAIEKYVAAHGGTYDGRFRNLRTIDGEPVDLHRYTISREQYAAAVGTSTDGHGGSLTGVKDATRVEAPTVQDRPEPSKE